MYLLTYLPSCGYFLSFTTIAYSKQHLDSPTETSQSRHESHFLHNQLNHVQLSPYTTAKISIISLYHTAHKYLGTYLPLNGSVSLLIHFPIQTVEPHLPSCLKQTPPSASLKRLSSEHPVVSSANLRDRGLPRGVNLDPGSWLCLDTRWTMTHNGTEIVKR